MENWQTIESFEAYEVSDLGRVRSVDRMVASRYKSVRLSPGKTLRPAPCTNGYLKVTLRKAGKTYTRNVHRLVAIAFIPNPLGLPEVNHTDAKSNNKATKLEWLSTADHGKDKAKRKQRIY